jgi:hypothetical protein
LSSTQFFVAAQRSASIATSLGRDKKLNSLSRFCGTTASELSTPGG